MGKIRLKKVTFSNCAVFELRLDNICSEFFKVVGNEMFIKLGAELTLAAVFDRMK